MPHPLRFPVISIAVWSRLLTLLAPVSTALAQTPTFVLQPNAASTGNRSNPYGVTVADVNGDGHPDALTANFNQTISVLSGDRAGGFTLSSTLSTGINSAPSSVTVADVNGDGCPDALVADYAGVLDVFLNTTGLLPTRAALPGTTAALYPSPARTTATLALAGLPATAAQVQATLLDATGRTVGQQVFGTAGGSLPLAGLVPGMYVVRLVALDASGRTLGELPAQRLSVW